MEVVREGGGGGAAVVLVARFARDMDRAAARVARTQLRDAVEAEVARTRARVRLVFDLRDATVTLGHLRFALRTLATHEAFVRATIERSCALLPPNRAVQALGDLFLALYTPVRPFRVHVDPDAARAYVRA